MANQTELQGLRSLWPSNSWESKCINALLDSGFGWTSGLVGRNGQPVSKLGETAWGVNIATCNTYCNTEIIPLPVFNFQPFASALTNYFLPWLALTAQLPYETGSKLNNAMSFCMAVGSPAQVTYSLTITIMNRARVRSLFKGLRSKDCESEPGDGKGKHKSRIKAAQTLLQEGQQVPLRASQVKGWLTSLVVLDKNVEWWTQLDGRLRDTRRGITASLVAQTLLAGVAYIFTVIISFNNDLGNPNTAEQIASGSLWIWLIPVIWGWISVGTQHRSDSVAGALNADWARSREVDVAGHWKIKKAKQKGIVICSGLNPLPLQFEEPSSGTSNVPTPENAISHVETHGGETEDREILNDPVVPFERKQPELIFPMLERLETPDENGDEQQRGPIYNYARIFTWWQLALTLESALYCAIEGTLDDEREPKSEEEPTEAWNNLDAAEKKFPTDIARTATYCGLRRPVLAYPEWSDIWPDVSTTFWVASLAAIILQWSTAGASILIAYQTPTQGLGCRSGSYLIYGLLGTLSWMCNLSSMLLSHEVMLRYQRIQIEHRWVDFRIYKRSRKHAYLSTAAIVLRRTGKILAAFNALWLIATSLFEFIGMFSNCWCSVDVLGRGSGGWIVLFKGKADLKNIAVAPWAGGLAITLIACTVSCLCFYLGCLETKEKQKS